MQQSIQKLSETCHEMVNLVQVLLGQALILQMKVANDQEIQEHLDILYRKCQHLKDLLDAHRAALLELRQTAAVNRS